MVERLALLQRNREEGTSLPVQKCTSVVVLEKNLLMSFSFHFHVDYLRWSTIKFQHIIEAIVFLFGIGIF